MMKSVRSAVYRWSEMILKERYIFPVYAIALPITETIEHSYPFGDWTEEVDTGRQSYEIWDQTCSIVCTCSEWATAEYIAAMMNNHNT